MSLMQRERVEPSAERAAAKQSPHARTSSARYGVSTSLLVLAALLASFLVNLFLVSWLPHRAAQDAGFDELREELAKGTAPVSQTDFSGKHLLEIGAPVAVLKIPRIGVSQVVFNGTSPSVMMKGPGHERDTVLPGQAGTSVIMGRSGAYGGPFGDLQKLQSGDTLTVVTGQGSSTYRVIDSRRAGDMVPPPLAAGAGRLTLVTGAGTRFLPEGVLRVDAALVSTVQPTPASVFPLGSIAPQERPMGTDTTTVWKLVLWLQALIAVAFAAVWSWYRWGRWQTYIALVPLGLLIGIATADQITLMLPNLL